MSSARRISSVDDLEAERAGRCLNLAHLQHGVGIADIGHDRQPAKTGDNLAQEFEPLAGKIGLLDRQAGDVAARSRQTRDEAGADRVARRREHDRDDRCRLLCREDCGGSSRDNDIDLEPDELGRDLGEALGASLRPAILDRDGATLDPAEFAQPLHKSGDPWRHAIAGVPEPRNPMVGSFAGLLRARRERPRGRRAAEQRDELAALSFDHLVGAGEQCPARSRPSILAVLRLMTSSNLVACTTGRSAALAPLRMRPA